MNKAGRNKRWLVLAAVILIAGCGGGGGGGGPATYTVGGLVSGLTGTVVLQNNSANDLSIVSNGTFTFATALTDGSAYSVTVKTQPVAQSCFVTTGTGTVAGANVTNVAVNCANSGSLDTTFGSAGIIVNNNAAGGNGGDFGVAIAVDSSGRLLVTGQSFKAAGNIDMAIWRFKPDGTLDGTFDTDGIVVHDSAAGGNSFDTGRAIALDASGRILVAGQSANASGNADMVIWRFNADGTLDTTFDTDGIVVHGSAAGGNGDDRGNAVALDASGRILVAGESVNAAGNSDMVIWRFKPDGTLDGTFDTDGIVVHNSAAGGDSFDDGSALALDSSGRILVAGFSRNAADFAATDMAIWRFNADGTLDTTFDTDGIVVHNNAAGGNGFDSGSAIALDASGRILVTGFSRNAAGNADMVIWRYNADGTLDTAFDTDGIVVHNNAAGGNSFDSGNAIASDSSGRILVTGPSLNATGNLDMVIWRYRADGTPDTTFNIDGKVVHKNAAGGDSDDFGSAIALDSSGRILVTGSSYNASNNADMVIWRYNP